MKKIKGTKKMLKHILKSAGSIRFDLVSTSYGVSSELFNVSYEVEDALESALRSFDYDYHSDSGLERGDSREYLFYLEKNKLMCKLSGDLSHYDYSDFHKKVYEEFRRVLARVLEIPEETFRDDFYFEIHYDSGKSSESDEFYYASYAEEEEIHLNEKQVEEVKKSIAQFSAKHGANRYERKCDFCFDMSSDHQSVTEYWIDEFEVTDELNDKVNYEFE